MRGAGIRGDRRARTALTGRRRPGTLPVVRADGSKETFETRCRIDTVNELEYFLNGGILPYVLRKLAA